MSTISLKFNTGGIDWGRAAKLFRRAPLGIRDPNQLRRAFENSAVTCFAFHGHRLVAAARALSDGEYQAAVYDMVVLPEYQGRGIGRRVMTAIHRRLPVRTTILYAVPGKEVFYQKLGYRKMRTAMARRTEDIEVFREQGYIDG
jgi:aralkylamine N-acetyltransferase